jgi:hypothetical protein
VNNAKPAMKSIISLSRAPELLTAFRIQNLRGEQVLFVAFGGKTARRKIRDAEIFLTK